jgi:F0F1-type ATP synthase epsilon subunit
MKKSTAAQELTVVARSPFRIYYEGPARMVSAANRVGKFDILPGHADFFSVMTPGEVIIETETESISFKISNGITTVQGNEAVLFVNM